MNTPQLPSQDQHYDAYAPREIAARIVAIGVTKAQLPLLPLAMLAVLAGAFIGLGAMASVIVGSDASLGFATSRFFGGLVFSLGLILVVVAGAELFTGNNLLVMAWSDGRISTAQLIRNWAISSLGNFVGAVMLAILVFLSGHTDMNDGAVAAHYWRVAATKSELPFMEAFVSGVLCNVLVCSAVWMAMGGRSVIDKAVAIVFPVMVFVAAGFEHSIANMYFISLALMLQEAGTVIPGTAALGFADMLHNLIPVMLGNLFGGSVLVGVSYQVIYRRGQENTHD